MDDFRIRHLAEIDSTNLYCRRNFDDLAHHSVVYADSQSEGRGRLDRVWQSPPRGNLYVSLIEKRLDSMPAVQPANLTQLMALAAVAVCARLGVQAGMKWPNDIYAGKSKLGGILSESSFSQGRCRGIIVGCGMNLNWAPTLPADGSYQAQSIRELSGTQGQGATFAVDDVLGMLLAEYASRYVSFAKDGYPAIASELDAVLIRPSGALFLESDDYRQEYQFVGLGLNGQLLVQDLLGNTHEVHSGDVKWPL